MNATFASTITVTSDGRWSGGIFTGGDLTKPWTGGMSTIEVIDRMPPGDADLPFGFFTHSLTGPTTASPRSRASRRAASRRCGPTGPAIPGTGVTDLVRPSGEQSPIDYRLDPGRSYAFTVTGTGDGTFGDGLLGGRAGATVQGLRTKAGQEDHVTLTPGVAGLKLDPGGAASPATLKLLDRTGKASTQTADVSLPARHGSTESATLSGGSLSLRHAGPGTSVTVHPRRTRLRRPGLGHDARDPGGPRSAADAQAPSRGAIWEPASR